MPAQAAVAGLDGEPVFLPFIWSGMNAENALPEYYDKVTLLLNITQDDSFTPNIDPLDTIMNSINIVE